MQHSRVAIGHAMGWQVAIQVGPLGGQKENSPGRCPPPAHSLLPIRARSPIRVPDRFGGPGVPGACRCPMETNRGLPVRSHVRRDVCRAADVHIIINVDVRANVHLPEICTFRPTKTLLARLTPPPMDDRLQTRAPGSILASGATSASSAMEG